MPDVVISDDSIESDSMVPQEVTATDDGWETESSSTLQIPQPDPEGLSGDVDASSQGPAEPPEPVNEDHDDSQTDDDQPQADADLPKKKLSAKERQGVLQAQFNALTRQKHEMERSIEARKAELAALTAPSKPAEARREPLPEPATDTSEPNWDEYEADGKTFAHYTKDHNKWLRETVIAEATTRATQSANDRAAQERVRLEDAAIEARFNTRIEQLIEAHPDFETLAKNLDNVDGQKVFQTPFLKAVVFNHPKGPEFLYHMVQHPGEALILSHLPMTRPIMDAVKASSDPTMLLSFFARNQEEHARIAYLDPASALLALGRLTAELSGPGAKNGSPARTPPVTTAKPPIRPIGTTRSAGVSHSDDLDSIPFGPEFVRRAWERDNKDRI